MEAVMDLFHRIVDKPLLVRRVNITANQCFWRASQSRDSYEQLSFFTDYDAIQKMNAEEEAALEREKKSKGLWLI